MKKVILFILVLLSQQFSYPQTDRWFEKETLDCIVLLQKFENGQYVSHGVGFLIYNYNSNETGIVVTCNHVLRWGEIYVVIRPDSALRSFILNSRKKFFKMGNDLWELDGEILRTKIVLKENLNYFVHDSLDIAAFKIGMVTRVTSKVGDSTVTKPVIHAATIPQSWFVGKENIGLGTDIYFVGFPFGIGTSGGYLGQGLLSEETPTPLLRSGIIAWISNSRDEFLLDAFSYGGNSGSPVFTKRTSSQIGPSLIGIVTGHLGNDSINFGLARC
jgi:hypothetical protein